MPFSSFVSPYVCLLYIFVLSPVSVSLTTLKSSINLCLASLLLAISPSTSARLIFSSLYILSFFNCFWRSWEKAFCWVAHFISSFFSSHLTMFAIFFFFYFFLNKCLFIRAVALISKFASVFVLLSTLSSPLSSLFRKHSEAPLPYFSGLISPPLLST